MLGRTGPLLMYPGHEPLVIHIPCFPVARPACDVRVLGAPPPRPT